MKTTVLALCALAISFSSLAQNDSTGKDTKADTIRIGGMVIIKKSGKDDDKKVIISNRQKKKPSNLSTNWWIVDLGFANFHDQTNYSSAEAQAFAPSSSKDQFDLRTGKSVNVNIWAFMQKLNVIKHVVNLKYGLGVELNNYSFDDVRVRFQKNPTKIIIDPAYADLKKNKLAADYVTVPLLLNLDFTPGHKKGFGISAGVSGGYLYSARQKTKINDKKDKIHDNFDLRKFKVSYIGEVNLGPVRLYGSYATKSMWEKGLDQTPYNVGIRFSNW
jgi:hypothetical protein